MSKFELDFTGIETGTSDPYYDIMNGYFDEEIECEETKKALKKAKSVINNLYGFLEENDLVL